MSEERSRAQSPEQLLLGRRPFFARESKVDGETASYSINYDARDRDYKVAISSSPPPRRRGPVHRNFTTGPLAHSSFTTGPLQLHHWPTRTSPTTTFTPYSFATTYRLFNTIFHQGKQCLPHFRLLIKNASFSGCHAWPATVQWFNQEAGRHRL